MKQLIITAHPSSEWFTHKIAQRFKKVAEKCWNEVELIDLYDKKYKQEFCHFEKMGDLNRSDPVRDLFHEKLSWADEYIFVFPVWWSFMPAIMKNFFDVNFSSGFAFRYDKTWKAHKLLTWKKAKVFSTCDGPWFFYKVFLFPVVLKPYFSMNLLGFCGIKVTDFVLFDKMRDKKQDDTRTDMLQKIEDIAQA